MSAEEVATQPHGHDDPHTGVHGGGEVDYAAGNRELFNRTAEQYDAVPGALDLGRNVGQAILAAYPFKEDETTVLEFACGTGLVSRELVGHVKQIVGVDISQGMADYYNRRFAEQGIPPEKIHAVALELKGEPGELDGQKFDVVFCSMAYHHIADIGAITRTLASFLKPGGTFIVVDGIKTPIDQDALFAKKPELKKAVAHMGGFAEADLRGVFESAQLQGFEFKQCCTAKIMDVEFGVFLAKAVKRNNV